jgi:hypothetical protein
MEVLADQTMSAPSGLAPWWVCEGGAVTRCVFDVPTSEQKHWLHWMKEQRLLYRLALGQPNWEDLVEVLASKGGLSPQAIREAVINLSPWFRAAVKPEDTRVIGILLQGKGAKLGEMLRWVFHD